MTGFLARHGLTTVGLLVGFFLGLYLYDAGYQAGQRSGGMVKVQPLDDEEFGRVRLRIRIEQLDHRVRKLERRAGIGEAGEIAPLGEPLGALHEA